MPIFLKLFEVKDNTEQVIVEKAGYDEEDDAFRISLKTQMKSEEGNGWSLVTADGSLSACFEKTVIIEENNAHILT